MMKILYFASAFLRFFTFEGASAIDTDHIRGHGKVRGTVTNVERRLGKGTTKSKAMKKNAPSPTRSENCNLFNDYMAESIWESFDDYDSVYNIKNMRGAEVFSILPDLSSNLAEYFEKIDRSETVDSSDKTYYVQVLSELGKSSVLADGALFGDNGYENPGHGGIGNHDVVNVTNPVVMSTWGQFYNKSSDGVPLSCDTDPKIDDSECKFQVDGLEGPWWSVFDDSKDMSVVQSKNEVSQTCWTDGDNPYGIVMDQGLVCTFEPGVLMLAGMGLWRATKGPLQETDGENICEDGTDWDHPQKVVKPDVYQYLIANGAFDAQPNSCYVCNIGDKEEVNEVFQDYRKRCKPVDFAFALAFCVGDGCNHGTYSKLKIW